MKLLTNDKWANEWQTNHINEWLTNDKGRTKEIFNEL